MRLNDEVKVLLLVAVGIVCFESLSRGFETLLSADLRQIRSHGEIPERIVEARKEGRESVLVLGNSLARAGLREQGIRARFADLGRPEPEVLYLTPDASDVSDWTAAYRRFFDGRNGSPEPDYLLVGTGRNHLEDRKVVSPEKLAAYHARGTDYGMILRTWLGTTDERARFLIASVSSLFANRERLRPILFYNYVPGYENVAQRLNEGDKTAPLPVTDRAASADRFDLLLESIHLPAEKVMVTAIPLPWPYELTPAVLELAGNRGVRVFTEESGREWPDEAFPDGYHLAPDQGALFTQAVMARLLP
jgi:hypothetical protein